MPRTGPVQILTGGPAPGSRPERVAIYGAPLNVQTASRLQTVVARGADLAVLVTGELPGARWRLQVDDSGVLTCDELSLQVTANRLATAASSACTPCSSRPAPPTYRSPPDPRASGW